MEIVRKEKVDIMRNFRIVESLYNEAVSLGVIPLKNPLAGLAADVNMATLFTSVSKTA